MKLEDIKMNLVSSLNSFLEKVKNSYLYNLCVEKYQDLDFKTQKRIQYGVITFIGIAILVAPISWFAGSTSQLKSFEDKRELSLNLLKSSQSPSSIRFLSPSMFNTRISSLIRSLPSVQEAQLLNTPQNISIDLPLKEVATLVKTISVSHVNIEQVVDLAQKIEDIAHSIKVYQLHIEELKDNENYFKVKYIVVYFYPKTSRSS